MEALLQFYKKTWWLWLAFTILFIVLAINVSGLFYIFIPGLLGYSIYFGMIRGSEMQEK